MVCHVHVFPPILQVGIIIIIIKIFITVCKTNNMHPYMCSYHRGSMQCHGTGDCTGWYKCSVPYCAGTGNYLVWEVDELQADYPDILACGVTLPSSGTYSPTSLYQQHIREQWYYCTMCYQCISVQYTSCQ